MPLSCGVSARCLLLFTVLAGPCADKGKGGVSTFVGQAVLPLRLQPRLWKEGRAFELPLGGMQRRPEGSKGRAERAAAGFTMQGPAAEGGWGTLVVHVQVVTLSPSLILTLTLSWWCMCRSLTAAV